MFHQSIQPSLETGTTLAQILGSFSYALDLTEGQPAGHSVRSCWIGSRIGKAIGLSESERHQLYYAILLKDLGCSSNAARICELYEVDDRAFKQDYKTVGTNLAATLHFVFSRTASGASWGHRAAVVGNILRNGDSIAQDLITTRCTRGSDIARSLRFPEPVCESIYHLDEHWDGSGRPGRLRGDAIPLYSRIALLAQIADVFHQHAGPQAALDELRRRAGVWLDPELVEVAIRLGGDDAFWADLKSPFLEVKLTAFAPPEHAIAVDDDYLDDIAAAFGSVIDAKSPFTCGHSRRVADYTSRVATEMGVLAPRRRWLHRAALLHDVGKLGVSNVILDKPASLDDARMDLDARPCRCTPARSSAASAPCPISPRSPRRITSGSTAPAIRSASTDVEISRETRIITACDYYDALTADRPYRAALPQAEALEIMRAEVGTALDPDCFAALSTIVEKE